MRISGVTISPRSRLPKRRSEIITKRRAERTDVETDSAAVTQANAEFGDLDDDELAAVARRDRSAFTLIYRRYLDPVYRYCYRRLGHKEAAADACSLIFTNAFAALPRYRDGSFRAWLFTIAHHVIVSDFRDRRPHEAISDAFKLVDGSDGPEAIAIALDERRQTQALLAALSAPQRRILELRLSGLTGREIAEVLGMSHTAVKVAQFRAIARLRSLVSSGGTLEEHHDE